MKGNLNRKRKRFWIPVITGFIALYLVTMILATCLVRQKFIEDYNRTFEETAYSLLNSAYNLAEEADDRGLGTEEIQKEYQKFVNDYLRNTFNPPLQISVAVYDLDRNLLAQSGDIFDDPLFMLDDYFSFEEKDTLAKYYYENIQSSANYTLPGKYRILLQFSSDMADLYKVYVQEITWTEWKKDGEDLNIDGYTDPLLEIWSCEVGGVYDYESGTETEGSTFFATDSKVVWEWTNPKAGQEEKGGIIAEAYPVFPYMRSSANPYGRWRQWAKSDYLHGFPERENFTWEKGTDYPGLEVNENKLYYRGCYRFKIGTSETLSAYMEIRLDEHPWAAALDHMKYAYLAGLILTLACMFLVMYSFNRIYDRQMALEQTRRDLTNAMAHELKTPLGIIRNFAENLLEHNMEEKRDYYLNQIIGQTEEMDHLVMEMIEISKLDSEELVLKKAPVSMAELIHEQAERLEPLILEKNLQIQYRQAADFQVDGDREYLAKAVWNLLANAVDHNVPDGHIRVSFAADKCSIENTGKTLDEEQLNHAFDLFYTGDKSRGKEKKHMGLGLFLAKKIFTLHDMSLALENTDDGVRAVIRKS